MGLLYQFFPDARDNTWTPQEGNYRSVLRAVIKRRVNLVTDDAILLPWKYDPTTATALLWISLPTDKEKLAWVSTSFRGPFPPHVIYYFLGNESGGGNLMLLSYRDLANFLNGCTPHDIVHHIFHRTRLLVTARYLEDRLQSLFDCYRICLREKRRDRDAATIERAAHQQELSVLRQEAAMALTLAQGEGLGSQTGHRGTKAARLSRLPRPPGWQQP